MMSGDEQLPIEEGVGGMRMLNTFDSENWGLSELFLTSLCMAIPVVQASLTIPVGP